MIKEKLHAAPSGLLVLLSLLAVLAVDVVLFIADVAADSQVSFGGLICILLVPVIAVLLAGVFVVNPNEGRVLQFFGRYVGTVRDQGLRWPIRCSPSGASRCGCATSRPSAPK